MVLPRAQREGDNEPAKWRHLRRHRSERPAPAEAIVNSEIDRGWLADQRLFERDC
jgi:hypothetical protein